jgi:hypothetical protein
MNAVDWPKLHPLHPIWPHSSVKVPGLHLLFGVTVLGQLYPGGHLSHLSLPSLIAVQPVGQALHSDSPVLSVKVPFAHFLGTLVALPQYLPFGHGPEQPLVSIPVLSPYRPGAQGRAKKMPLPALLSAQ